MALSMDRRIVLIWLAVVGVTCGRSVRNPGLQLQLSQTGLDYAAHQAVDQLTAGLQGQHLKDVHGQDHMKVGKVKYDLTEMTITKFGKPSSKVKVLPNKGVQWSAAGATVSLHGKWHYKYRLGFIKVSDGGSFDVSTSGVDFSISAMLGVDQTGRPTIKSSGCSSHVGSLKVKFHGGASWLYNIFDHQIAKNLQHKLQDLMCKAASKSIDKHAEAQLAKVAVLLPMGGFTLDYRLLAPPLFSKGFIESLHKGEVSWTKDQKEPPFLPEKMPDTMPSSKMIYIRASDYIINSLSYSAFTHGKLQYNLSRHDLPGEKGDFLNTTCTKFGSICIGNFLYKLKEKYPDASVSVSMACTVAPSLSIAKTGISLTFIGNMIFYVTTKDAKTHYVFTTKTIAVTSLMVRVEGHTIKANLTNFKTKTSVTDSAIGNITDMSMTWFFKAVSKAFIKPSLRELGNRGLDLPNMKDAQFTHPLLQLDKGSVLVGADIVWNPKFHLKLNSKGR